MLSSLDRLSIHQQNTEISSYHSVLDWNPTILKLHTDKRPKKARDY
ncbi:hypothetical protein [Roseibacillus persicicus]|uniref:Uncharacterized protein n=1 Tax=Roseibacillus persicicus TaxID=454148 RepID=A0A918TI70_9BACT|nr:hypothetical protein [Roseibacillus persicicus]GHC49165.1 hypothetical protein GCM10007100_13820 [Roseibacillus persicicus]